MANVSRTKIILKVFVVSICLSLMASFSFAQATPKYVFYFIGDGMGPAQRQAAEYFYKVTSENPDAKLMMNRFRNSALVTTHSANTLITDSGAGGTALATGFKTTNDVISKLPDGSDVKTIAEAAKENGYAVGIATTTRLTHATPASFSAHEMSRYSENEIASDQVNSGFDFFAGGGYRHFVKKGNAKGLKSKRKDDRDLIAELQSKGYTTFVGGDKYDDFMAFKPKKGDKVFAPLAYTHIAYEIDRINNPDSENALPSLAAMTAKGIEVLSAQGKPFFMMIEGGRIDHAAHCHDAAAALWDTIALDDAIAEAYKFYQAHPNETLIVVAADHETGGLGMGISLDSKGYFLKLKELLKVDSSMEDILWKVYPKLYKKYKDVNKRHQTYLTYVAKHYGLTDLTDGEEKQLINAMEVEDHNQTVPSAERITYGYEYTPTMVAVARLVSYRARLNWASYVHTAIVIPMSAVGVGANRFNGFIDNTNIPQIMAILMEVKLTPMKHKNSKALLGDTVGPQKKYSEKSYL